MGLKDAGELAVARNKKWLQILILAAVVLIGGITIGNGLFADKPKLLQAQDAAPDFALKGLDGQAYRLSDFRGRPVVLNFWGTFCPPCVREMPLLQKMHESFKDQGVVILGVNLNEPEVTVRSFVRQYDIQYPILLDKGYQVRDLYGVMDYPTTFFIGKDGTIQSVFVGELNESYVQGQILKLMGNKTDRH